MSTNGTWWMGGLALAGLLCTTSGALYAADPTYRLIRELPVGGTGGGEDVALDLEARRLYVTHASKIDVVDLDAGEVVGEIPETNGVRGFALATALARGFSSNGADNTATIVDLRTLRTLSKVPTGANPHAVIFDPSRKEVYTFNASGRSATVFSAQTARVLATIDLRGRPGASVLDAEARRLFVALEDTATVALVSANTHFVTGRWPLPGCDGPTGLALAAAEQRLFTACRNKVLLVLDSVSGQLVTSMPIGGRAESMVFDPDTGLLFCANSEGTLSILRLDILDTLATVQTLKTLPGTRTIALDAATHQVYVPAARSADGLKILVFGTP